MLLQVADEWDLVELAQALDAEGTEHVLWFEPDLDSFTAVSSRPSKHFSSLPLLLRELAPT